MAAQAASAVTTGRWVATSDAHTENPCGAAPSTTARKPRSGNRCAPSATTTWGTSCSHGTCPNYGGVSPSPYDAISPNTSKLLALHLVRLKPVSSRSSKCRPAPSPTSTLSSGSIHPTIPPVPPPPAHVTTTITAPPPHVVVRSPVRQPALSGSRRCLPPNSPPLSSRLPAPSLSTSFTPTPTANPTTPTSLTTLRHWWSGSARRSIPSHWESKTMRSQQNQTHTSP